MAGQADLALLFAMMFEGRLDIQQNIAQLCAPPLFQCIIAEDVSPRCDNNNYNNNNYNNNYKNNYNNNYSNNYNNNYNNNRCDSRRCSQLAKLSRQVPKQPQEDEDNRRWPGNSAGVRIHCF